MVFRLLVVCVGNVCRSPLAERLLAARLPEGYEVASAGVGALVGSPMDRDAAAELERLGGSAAGFAARQLTPSAVAGADLVLTATRDLRSRVLEESPGALRRTFTLRELAALVGAVGPAATPNELVAAAARERSRTSAADLDLTDPYRRASQVHAEVADQVDVAVTQVARAFASLGP